MEMVEPRRSSLSLSLALIAVSGIMACQPPPDETADETISDSQGKAPRAVEVAVRALSDPHCWYHNHGAPQDHPRSKGFWGNCYETLNNYIHVDKLLWPDDYFCVGPQHDIDLGFSEGAVGNVKRAEILFEGCPNPR
jgi:hypothetical protein